MKFEGAKGRCVALCSVCLMSLNLLLLSAVSPPPLRWISPIKRSRVIKTIRPRCFNFLALSSHTILADKVISLPVWVFLRWLCNLEKYQKSVCVSSRRGDECSSMCVESLNTTLYLKKVFQCGIRPSAVMLTKGCRSRPAPADLRTCCGDEHICHFGWFRSRRASLRSFPAATLCFSKPKPSCECVTQVQYVWPAVVWSN